MSLNFSSGVRFHSNIFSWNISSTIHKKACRGERFGLEAKRTGTNSVDDGHRDDFNKRQWKSVLRSDKAVSLEGDENMRSEENGWKSAPKNVGCIPFSLFFLCLTRLSTESLMNIKVCFSLQRKIDAYLDSKLKTTNSSRYLESSDGGSKIDLPTKDCVESKLDINSGKLVSGGTVSRFVGDDLNYKSDFMELVTDLAVKIYFTYSNIEALSSFRLKDVTSGNNLTKFEISFSLPSVKRFLLNTVKCLDKGSGTDYKVKLENCNEIRKLSNLKELSNSESYQLKLVGISHCQENGAQMIENKLQETKINQLGLKLHRFFESLIPETGLIPVTSTPKKNNLSIKRSSFDERLFKSNEREIKRRKIVDCIKILYPEDFTEINENLYHSLLRGQSKIWSQYCYEFGHGTICPYKDFCLFSNPPKNEGETSYSMIRGKYLCSICNAYSLARDEEIYTHEAECYKRNSVVVSRPKNNGSQTLFKRYYNCLTGYSEIFCNKCGQVCYEGDFGSSNGITEKHIYHECKANLDFPFSLTSTTWPKIDESLEQNSGPQGRECGNSIWKPKGEFGAAYDFPQSPLLLN